MFDKEKLAEKAQELALHCIELDAKGQENQVWHRLFSKSIDHSVNSEPWSSREIWLASVTGSFHVRVWGATTRSGKVETTEQVRTLH